MIVEEPHHGSGLGYRVVAATVEYPSLSAAEKPELYCGEDRTSFYEPSRSRSVRCAPAEP